MTEDRGLSFGNKPRETTTTEFANNWAYVIGINAYHNGIPQLQTAVADAERLGEILKESHGYTVLTLPRNGAPTLTTLRELIHKKMLQEVGPNDRVLFYFAGHGIALDGEDGPEGFLVPEDANREDRRSFLSMTEFNDALAKLPCRHLLLILDCCFAGAFRWSSTRDLSSLPSVIHRERYDRYIQDPAWQVLTSAAYDQKALDVLSGSTIGERTETGGHSPFASALFCALTGEADLIPRGKADKPGGDGVITATELYLYLRESVETETEAISKRQTPGLWPLKKHDKGEYILLTPGHTLNLPPAPELNEASNPYRGLQSFDQEHATFFFGRSKFIATLAERVAVQSLTIVLGASGTGKSSVVKAGLLPFLRFRDADAWHILLPFRPGKSPLAALAAVVIPGESCDPVAITIRLESARADIDALAHRVGNWAATMSSMTRLLIVVDQFEELLTLCWDAAEREQFLIQLDRALTAYPDQLRVVLTLRSDFEPQFANSPLQEEWLNARIVVPVMTLDEYREAIEGPASVKVLYFHGKASSQAFIDRLIGDVANTPGALPLLSFTLSELYRRYLARNGDDRALMEADYEALGGVGGSLRNSADEVYTGLPDDAHRATMKRVMLRMVSVEGGELARRRAPDEELVYEGSEENRRVQEIVRRLTESRLVVEGKEIDGQAYVEPAHDELVRGWDKLLHWSREEAENLQLRRRLTVASSASRHGYGGLWLSEPRLRLLNQVLQSAHNWLNREESRFIRRSVFWRRIWSYAIVAAAAVVIGLGLLAKYQTGMAQQKDRVAKNNSARAEYQTGRVLFNRSNVDESLLWWCKSYTTADDPEWKASMANVIAGSLPRLDVRLDGAGYIDFAFGSDGQHLLVTKGGTVQLLDTRTSKPVKQFIHRDKAISAVAISPDGRRILTASEDHAAQLFDADSAELIEEIEDINTHAFAMESQSPFSPDGTLLLFLRQADGGRTLKICDGNTGRLCDELKHGGTIHAVAVSSNGKRVLTGSEDQTALLWDAEFGAHRELSHNDKVWSVSLSHNGELALTGSGNAVDPRGGTAQLWDANTGDLQAKPLVHEAPVIAVAFNPVLPLFLTSSGAKLRIWETTGKECATMDQDSDNRILGFSSDGSFLLSVKDQSTVEIRNVLNAWRGDNRPANKLQHEHEVRFAKFIPESELIVTRSHMGRLWQLQKGSSSGVLRREFKELSDGARRLQRTLLSPDGVKLVTAGYAGDEPVLWNVRGGKLRAELEHTDPVGAAGFSNDGNFVVTGTAPIGGKGVVQTWETITGTRSGNPIITEHAVQSVAFSRDGAFIVTGHTNGTAQIWEVRSGEVQLEKSIVHGDQGWGGVPAWVGKSTFSPDGKFVLTGNKLWRLWATEDGHAREPNPFRDRRVVLNSDGTFLLAYTDTASGDSEGQVWDFRTLKPISQPLSVPGDVIALSLDGTLAIVKKGSVAQILDLKTGQWRGEPLEHQRNEEIPTEQVRSAAFSPDGSIVLTGSWNGIVHFWDSHTGFPCGELVHDNPVETVAFNADGTLALTVSGNTVRIWDVPAPPIDDQDHPTRLQLSVEVRTRMRINDNREAQELTDIELHTLRKTLEEMGGPCDAPTWEEYKNWQVKQRQ